ncbi:TetR/AcrR family transcriptional regulator [Inconstantimicrobium mannanitabidum]|uniref:TetR family transcriptional regulator n=1 Tax=Inconstantimicrobium mannanitabidum TaxID=1604901 RepID=A0ACB5R809_9CLOT|nr:TetR/AcrR family transcriptional regulator [Clostridium sp. TW13]GKX65302.1 TetR family transcriptional regulator [Clostridium sp. TW13]
MELLTKRQRKQLEREDFIVSKAEDLFCTHGFDKVSMDTIAKECNFTKRTIYRYFSCKEDLFFAVALKGYEHFLDHIKKQMANGNTGFEKIRLAYYAYYDFYRNSHQLLQVMNTCAIIKSTSADTELPYHKKLISFDKQVFEGLTTMFDEGKTDGSIRSDLEISQLALSSIFVTTGFFKLLSLSGNTYTTHFNLNGDEFIKFTIEMLLDSLKNKQ